jgi:hypothetical protein
MLLFMLITKKKYNFSIERRIDMAIRTAKNQYRGINAHLHSHWQAVGGWDEFHTSHIVHLAGVLKAQLLPMGYTAGIEQSLQIRRQEQRAGKPEADVTIYDMQPTSRPKTLGSQEKRDQLEPDAYQMILTLPEVLAEEEELSQYRAIGIYRVDQHNSRGEVVAWVELLSPSNKSGGQDALYYQDKRRKLLEGGLVFVELDYLHETPPTFQRIPNYAVKNNDHARPANAHPYRVIVIDPRPALTQGAVYVTAFDVDEPIPSVAIPLNAGDSIRAMLNEAYQNTFEAVLFGLEWVDYAEWPAHFERYSPEDQARISARMMAVQEAATRGQNLEQGAPFDVPIAPDAV